MKTEPQKEHQWRTSSSRGTYDVDSPMEPGKPPEKFTGTESVGSLGSLWPEGRGEMPGGGTAAMMMTRGYDPQRKALGGHLDRVNDDAPLGVTTANSMPPRKR